MSKFTSLTQLINSLSKSERKKISSTFNWQNNDADYILLYRLIDKNQLCSQQDIKELFMKKRPNAAFNTAIKHLFDTLLTILSQLRTNQDRFFSLTNLLMNAKVLFEKSIYQECFNLLKNIQEEAIQFENFNILLIAQKMELDYLLCLNFQDITEQELLTKQLKLNDTLKKIRKVNEHASLYELLKYRILNKGTARSKKHIQALNDLVVSEMSIVSSSNFENFEIKKNHKLFQSNYLIYVGDYNSALYSFYELNTIFEQNKFLLSNPPIYYLMTIEGVLDSLRNIKNYKGMSYFIDQLTHLESSSSHFMIQVKCVVFLYTIFPMIDTGRFSEAKNVVENYKDELHNKITLLIPERRIQLSLFTAIVYFGLNEHKKARKALSYIISGEKKQFSIPLLRTMRLVNLMILYELNEFDYIEFEIRSLKREIQNNDMSFQFELLILKVLGKQLSNLSEKERISLWERTLSQINIIKENKFEMQLIHTFDFTAWIESKIKNIPMELVLKERNVNKNEVTKN